MIGTEFLRDGTGIFRFGKFGFAKNNRERAWSYASSTKNADQRAGVDASGKKYAEGHVADQLGADGLFQHRLNARERAGSIPCRARNLPGIRLVVVINQVPIARNSKRTVDPSQTVTCGQRMHSFDQRERIVCRTE